MGLWGSKNSKKKEGKGKGKVVLKNVQDDDDQQDEYEVENPSAYDLAAIQSLHRDLVEDTETFVLNLMLMSLMFFDDFQDEMRTLVKTIGEKGKSLNSKLIQEHQKQFLMPDAVMEIVDKRVKFQSTSGPNKGKLEPIVPPRMFVLHDTIEIVYKEDTVDYIGIDKPCYRATIEESRENRGFVKVNLLGTSGSSRKGSTDSAFSTTPTKLYQKKENGTPPAPSDAITTTGNDSGVNSESDYEYTKITFAKTPRRLQISEKDIYTRISQLPTKCITPMQIRNEVSDSETDSEDEDEDDAMNRGRNVKVSSTPLFLMRYYLNSKEFMRHFKDNVFPNHLGEVLGFSAEAIQQATSISGAIYCDKVADGEAKANYEVIPAIAMPWPEEIAFEWLLRRRITVRDKRTQISYKWPTENMVKEAKRFDCVVMPKGFMPKRGDNPSVDIEWEVGFPKAERYLEIRMSHVQVRIFLYVVMLFKTFIEPATQKRGLLIDHVRMLMFWECETNYKAWPEDKMGIKLKLILQKLFDHLSKQQLPHYFIRTKNVLKNVPARECRYAQDIIHQALESPVLYLLSSLKGAKYASAKFYPELDFKELYLILTSDEALKKANPGMLRTIELEEQTRKLAEQKRKKEEEKKDRNDKERKWNKRYQEHQRFKKAKELHRRSESQNLSEDQKQDNGAVDVKSQLKDFKNNVFRQALLLEFFADHFLRIAERSLKVSSTTQVALFYLKQSWYLAKLLERSDIDKARKFQQRIKAEEENCGKRAATEEVIPSTPKRNSTLPSPDVLQVKGKEINMVNLTKNYNAEMIVNEQKVSSPAVKKKTKAKQNSAAATERETAVVEVHHFTMDDRSKSDESIQKSNSIDKGVRKSVSFRSEPHINIDGIEEEEGQTTTL